MVIIFFALLFAMMMFTFSFTSYSLNGINKIVMYVPLEIFQNNVYVLEYEEPANLYFEEENLTSDLRNYFTKLEKYTNSYSLMIIYTTAEGKLSFGTTHQGVLISISAEAYFDYDYSRTLFYKVGEAK